MSSVRYQKATLSNGITLVGESHPHVRSVSLGAWARVGACHEPGRINGVSHFIEHMLFKGTEKRTAIQIATALESLGGDLNAFTDREYTCYHATVLSEHTEIAFDVLSDLVLHPTFPPEEMERERKVLLQELSMVEETPDDLIQDIFFETVWGKAPLGQSVIGTKKSILGISRAALKRYYDEHYRPDRLVISVAGNVEFEQLLDLGEKYFGSFKQEPLAKKVLEKSPFHANRRAVKMDSEQLHLLVGYEGLGFRDPRRFEALILSFFLGGGMSSRLFQEIREKEGLAYSVDCDFSPFTDTGLFTVYVAMAPKSLSRCLEIISREIGRLQKTPLSEADLGIVKGQLKGGILLSSDNMDVRQESLGRNELVFGRYVSVEEVIEALEKVSPESIQSLAQDLFRKGKEALVALGSPKPSLARLKMG